MHCSDARSRTRLDSPTRTTSARFCCGRSAWTPRSQVRDAETRRAVGYSWIDDHLEAQTALGDGALARWRDSALRRPITGGSWRGFAALGEPPARYRCRGPDERARSGGCRDPEPGRQRQMGRTASCPVAWMYGAGSVVSDCSSARCCAIGGLPGFGSQLLVLRNQCEHLCVHKRYLRAPVGAGRRRGGPHEARGAVDTGDERQRRPAAGSRGRWMYQSGDVTTVPDI
jgi:hypothetical protein